jgi:hypothetical protein
MNLLVDIAVKTVQGLVLFHYRPGSSLSYLARELMGLSVYSNYDRVAIWIPGGPCVAHVDLLMARAQPDPSTYTVDCLTLALHPTYADVPAATNTSGINVNPSISGSSIYYGGRPGLIYTGPAASVSASFIQHLPDQIGVPFEMVHVRTRQDHRMAPHETWQDFYDQTRNLFEPLIIAGDTFHIFWRDDQNVRHTETFFIKSDGLTGLADSIYEFISGKRITSPSSGGGCTRHDPYTYVGLFETGTYCRKCEVKLS